MYEAVNFQLFLFLILKSEPRGEENLRYINIDISTVDDLLSFIDESSTGSAKY